MTSTIEPGTTSRQIVLAGRLLAIASTASMTADTAIVAAANIELASVDLMGASCGLC